MTALPLIWALCLAHPLAEPLARGLVAVPADGAVHVSWRLLPGDPVDLAFNVYRVATDGSRQRVNAEPIALTTDLLDAQADALEYELRAVVDGREGEPIDRCRPWAQPYLRIPVNGDDGVQKCGLGDLDGDGQLDFVFKSPNRNVDPYKSYWVKSTEPYRLQAIRSDGTPLWSFDLGWSIERGIWYSPYLVYDLDRDGRAEVALKAGEGDPRDADGRVQTGPEWLLVLDGQTGAERAKVPWPDRSGFGEGETGYNFASRNQMAVAWLDGQRPSLVALRGTYTRLKAEAWDLHGGQLRSRWRFDSEEPGVRGQGAHFTHSVDLDGDGRDELLLGSLALDDDGTPLWSTRLGHPDYMYLGDLNPGRPGLEIQYGIESRRDRNGLCQVDAATGQILWGLDQPTQHVHSSGLVADIDPAQPGSEAYGADSADHQPIGARWLYAADGRLLSREVDYGFRADTAYWDADLQREVLWKGQVIDHDSAGGRAAYEGSVLMVADLYGDWREEVVTSRPGEVRIYSTGEPAFDRRVTLLADPLYRANLAHLAMGYEQPPSHLLDLESTAPNLNLRFGVSGDPAAGLVVVSAPVGQPLHGRLSLRAGQLTVRPASLQLDLAAGERRVLPLRLDRVADDTVAATLEANGRSWTTTAPVAGWPTNGGYERRLGDAPAGWAWWSRDGSGSALSDDQRQAGDRGVAVTFDGERDWAFTCAERLSVAAGERVAVSGWARAEQSSDLRLCLVAYDSAGKLVTWELAKAQSRAPHDWQLYEAAAVVPDGVATVAVRWVGSGPTRVWLDEVARVTAPVRQ